MTNKDSPYTYLYVLTVYDILIFIFIKGKESTHLFPSDPVEVYEVQSCFL